MTKTTIDAILPERVYTPTQIGEFYQFSPNHIRGQIAQGKLTGHISGRDIRIKGRDAISWFEGLSTKPQAILSGDKTASMLSGGSKTDGGGSTDFLL